MDCPKILSNTLPLMFWFLATCSHHKLAHWKILTLPEKPNFLTIGGCRYLYDIRWRGHVNLTACFDSCPICLYGAMGHILCLYSVKWFCIKLNAYCESATYKNEKPDHSVQGNYHIFFRLTFTKSY